MSFKAPVTYQGGKGQIADLILNQIPIPSSDTPFYDLCCGAGSVTCALLNRGHNPRAIHMIDAGPMGAFWQAIAERTFNLNRFREIVESLPVDQAQAINLCRIFQALPWHTDSLYHYLIMQSATFGGCALPFIDGKWKRVGFRSPWGLRDSGTYAANAFMPLPQTLLTRVEALIDLPINARCCDVREINPPHGAIVYIDPPYEGTSKGYQADVDVTSLPYARFVSDARPHGEHWKLIQENRTKGGISGARAKAHREYLSWICL